VLLSNREPETRVSIGGSRRRRKKYMVAFTYHPGEVVVGASPVALDGFNHTCLQLDVVRGSIAAAETHTDLIGINLTQFPDL